MLFVLILSFEEKGFAEHGNNPKKHVFTTFFHFFASFVHIVHRGGGGADRLLWR